MGICDGVPSTAAVVIFSFQKGSHLILNTLRCDISQFYLFICFVALRPKSTALIMAGRSVHLTILFPGQA